MTQSIRQKFISMIQRSNRFSSSSNWIENFWCKILILSCATQEASLMLHRRFLFRYCFPSSPPCNTLKSLEQYFVSGLVIKISLLRAVLTVQMLNYYPLWYHFSCDDIHLSALFVTALHSVKGEAAAYLSHIVLIVHLPPTGWPLLGYKSLVQLNVSQIVSPQESALFAAVGCF